MNIYSMNGYNTIVMRSRAQRVVIIAIILGPMPLKAQHGGAFIEDKKKSTTVTAFGWKGSDTFRNFSDPNERLAIMTTTPAQSKLDGIWVRDSSNKTRGFKWFFKGCLSVTYADISTGKVIDHYEGAFEVTGYGHREIFAYSTTSTSPPPGKVLMFNDTISPDGQSYSQTNEQGGVEIWRRLPETRTMPAH